MASGNTEAQSNRAAKVAVIALAAVVLGGIALAGIGLVPLIYRVPGEPTPLMRAARLGDAVEVRRLLATGADVDERRGFSIRAGLFAVHGPSTAVYGDSALLSAIEAQDVEIVRILLDAGADGTVEDTDGRGIWDYAVGTAMNSDVYLLLAERFDVPPEYVDQALGWGGGDERMLEFLLSRPSSTLARESALCGFAARGELARMDRVLQTLGAMPAGAINCALGGVRPARPKVEYLLARGADPNGGGRSMQPLSAVLLSMYAGSASESVPDEMRELLEVLLRAGADPHLAPAGSSSAIDLARFRGDEAAAAFLEAWQQPAQPER